MKPHAILKEYVELLLSTDTNSLVVKGSAGVGKTHTVLETLQEAGLEENVHFIYVTGFITPLELFTLLFKSVGLENPKLFVFDDLEGIMQNKTSIALLKSALWDARGKRMINYQSSSSKLDGVTNFEFKGKVMLIINNLKEENMFSKSLLDRGIFYEMNMSGQDKINYIEQTILPSMKIELSDEAKKEVWKRIKIFSTSQTFSFRSLTRAYSFYKHAPEKWFPLFLHTLNDLTEEQKAFYAVREKGLPTIKEEIKEFHALVGGERKLSSSEKAYHRIKTN